MRAAGTLLVLAGLLCACALPADRGTGPAPGPRLDALPTRGLALDAPVEVRWNAYGIPFITAATDDDAAFALGLVQAHLRLGQIAVARQIAEGRISEMAGPWTTDIDAAIRAFGFGRASRAIYEAMPDRSRRWLDRFVAGINAYAERLPPDGWPHEFAMGGIDWRPWRPEDAITLGRVSGIDINWGTYIRMLRIPDPEVRAEVFARLAGAGRSGTLSFGDMRTAGGDPGGFARLAELGRIAGKSGSNSVVVGPERSASGAALIASDPHLGFFLPNLWLIAGLRSPSYQTVGMMVPGTPVFGFGRTPDLAWGGTNLRATTSELVDLTTVAPDSMTPVTHRIGVRFWQDETWQTAETPYGPALSGTAALLETATPFAVRWVGHRVTDEITALLGAMRARGFDDFREAMRSFALPPQTFLVATRDGDIGSVVATTVPARPAGDPLRLLTEPERSDRHWSRLVSAPDLPFALNPPGGAIASANNRPSTDQGRPFGGVFPQDERIRRLGALLDDRPVWSLDDLGRLQMDTVSLLARETLDRVAPHAKAWPATSAGERRALNLLAGWDGDYAVDSHAAPVYEAFVEALIPALYAHLGIPDAPALYGSGYIRRFAYEDLERLDSAGWRAVLGSAVPAAAAMAEKGLAWGDLHRVEVGHIFGRIPLIGRLYRERTIPIQGAQTTIFKTAHATSLEPHVASFGAQSRHLSDMSDPDANHFVLFGGQDGWIGAANFSDQVDLWRAGKTIRVPLTPKAVAEAFPTVVRLLPSP